MPARKPVALLATALLVMLLTGCDARYKFTVENHQARDVRIFIGGIDFDWVKSCSVDTIEFNAPPRQGRRVPVQAKDAQGNLIYQSDVEVDSGPRGTAAATIRIPEGRSAECPTLYIKSTATPSATPTTPAALPDAAQTEANPSRARRRIRARRRASRP